MAMRRRVERLERELGCRDVAVPIILDGRNEDLARAAYERGGPVQIVRIEVTAEAETMEEAEAIIAQHRDLPVTVCHPDGRLLAEWDPGLPEWCRSP